VSWARPSVAVAGDGLGTSSCVMEGYRRLGGETAWG
jgi:hypothetical protein